jgi:DnaJ like chaperone protein
MSGKVLGAMIGATVGLAMQSALAAAALALFGIYVGHRFDLLHSVPDDPGLLDAPPARTPASASVTAGPAAPGLTFSRNLCTLFIELARCDGPVVREEIRTAREYFERDLQFDAAQLDIVRKQLKASMARPREVDAAARDCAEHLEPKDRLLVLSALYDVALADGGLQRSEQDCIRRIAVALGITEDDQRTMAQLHLGDGTAYFEALGLGPGATDQEVKTAFRRLAAEHHPDKASHLGARAQEAASRRFQDLRDAYDAIRKRRGF